ncbi:hypothetical protein BZL29_0060 [Mycobacterium kansasii]|uniref:Uncharacterized protein n=1 Tax=Mycobacterium kansasii TaxID=1768 RepID=A0A1V3XYR1_MYCKA|nr:hypothetical protein BZL29_0060 [Mycobacterium kansasii]
MKPGSTLPAAASRLRLFNLRELAVHRRRTSASIAVMAVAAMYLVAVFGIFGSITGSVNRLADGSPASPRWRSRALPTPVFPTRSRPTSRRSPVSALRRR